MTTCACCVYVVEELREAQRTINSLSNRLAAEVRRAESWRDDAGRHRNSEEQIARSNRSLRGALTKAKKRIDELKGGAA